MKYELWDVVPHSYEEPAAPLTLLHKSDLFEEIYLKFKEVSKTIPCVIFTKPVENKPKIYESPDGGKTIYERDSGNYVQKRKIK